MQEVVADLEIDSSLIHGLWVVKKVAHAFGAFAWPSLSFHELGN